MRWTLPIIIAMTMMRTDAVAQGFLGASNRLQVVVGGSVFPNVTLLWDGANDFEVAGEFLRCVSPQWEIGVTVGKNAFTVDGSSSSSSEDAKCNVEGLMIGGEARYYLRGVAHSTAPSGYFIRPALRYQKLGSVADLNTSTYGDEDTVSELTGSAISFSFGFGRQTFFGEHITAGWTATCGIPLTVTTTGEMESTVKKDLFRTQTLAGRFSVGYQF